MRAVVDTNVLMSGLLWHDAPHTLLEHIRRGALTLISSPALIAELADVIMRAKFRTTLARANSDPARLLSELRRLTELVDPPTPLTPRSRDPDDDNVLALAVAARPDLIISGDNDLLVLGTHAGMPIVTPVQALALIAAASR